MEEQPEGLYYSKDVGGGRIHVHDNLRVVYSRVPENNTMVGTKEDGGGTAWGSTVSSWGLGGRLGRVAVAEEIRQQLDAGGFAGRL